MKLLKTIIVIFIISLSSNIYAQPFIYCRDEVVANENNQEQKTDDKKSKLQYSVNVGTGVSTGYFGNALNMFVEPELRYRLSPKWSISTGFLIMNSSISDLYTDRYKGRYNTVSSYLTAAATYHASEKLRITGEILYGMNKSPFSFDGNKNNSEYYLRFSAEYKINKSLSVGIEIINGKTNFSPFSDIYYGNRFSTFR